MSQFTLFLFQETANNSMTIPEIITMVKDIITASGVIIGLFLGYKGFKKYLLEDLIKTKVSKVHEANSKAREITKDIIQTVKEKSNINRPANENDLLHINSLTKRLVNSTIDSSSEIHSLAFLLHETTKNIELSIEKKTSDSERYEGRSASDFYNILLSTCYKINFFAGNIIDIPESRKTVEYHEIKKGIRKYLNNSGFETLENFQTGLDLHPNSAIPLIFYQIIKNHSNDYIFNRKLFQLLQDNTPLLYFLFENEIYFPLTIKAPNKKLIFGDGTLHLIKCHRKKTVMGENEGREFYEFTYSNLHHFVSFTDNIDKQGLKKDYSDSFLGIRKDYFSTTIKKFTRLGEESFKVECNVNDAEKYFKFVKGDLKSKLKQLKNS